MNKLKDLCIMSYKLVEAPKTVEIDTGRQLEAELLLENNILNPVIFLIASQLYFTAFNTPLCSVLGEIKKSDEAPYGIEIKGDLDDASLTCSTGYLVLMFCQACEFLKGQILESSVDDIAKYWVEEVLSEIPDQTVLSLDALLRLPILGCK